MLQLHPNLIGAKVTFAGGEGVVLAVQAGLGSIDYGVYAGTVTASPDFLIMEDDGTLKVKQATECRMVVAEEETSDASQQT